MCRHACVAAALFAVVFWIGSSPAAAQDDGLRVEAHTVYRVIPDEFSIEVEITYSVTNEVPNRRDGFTIVQTFFRGLTEVLPADAIDVGATRANGAALEVRRSDIDDPELLDDAGEPALSLWEIDFGPNLFHGQTRDFTLRYRLPDGPSRDLSAWARINPAFVSFVALARGDDGLVSVTVEIPDGFDVELFAEGTRPRRTVADGVQRWTVDGLDDPYEWTAFFVGSDHEGLDRTPFEVDDVGSFTVAAWPGDAEWTEWAMRTIEQGATFLEGAVGQPWPHDDPTLVMETVVPELAGYAGLYFEPRDSGDPRFLGIDAVVEIGEDLTTEVLNHELAHAWFNTDFSDMRWLNEGLAEYFGQLATDTAGVEDPHRFPAVSPHDRDALLLSRWNRGLLNDEGTELFGYAASFRVVSDLAAMTGPDGLADVIDALIDRRNPYAPELHRPDRLTWREVLDTFEVVGGADDAEAVLVEWVIGEAHESELAARRTALERRDEVAAHELAWDVPVVVPDLLGRWDLDEVERLLGDMQFLLDGQLAAIDYAAVLGVELPDDVEPLFEAVSDPTVGLEAAEAVAHEQRAAMVRLHAAQIRLAAPRSFVERLGLRGHDPDARLAAAFELFEDGDYEAAVDRAADAIAAVDAAGDRGGARLVRWGGSAAAGLAIVGVVLWLWRRRRTEGIAAR